MVWSLYKWHTFKENRSTINREELYTWLTPTPKLSFLCSRYILLGSPLIWQNEIQDSYFPEVPGCLKKFRVFCRLGEWTLKHRSFFQLSIIIKDMSFMNNIDQRIFNSCFVISGLIPGMLVLSGGPIIIYLFTTHCKLEDKSPTTEAWHNPLRFLCHWLPPKSGLT